MIAADPGTGRRLRLAYYAHHHGTGHLRHAQNVASLDLVDLLVTSTGPRNRALLQGPAEYVSLEPDVRPDGVPFENAPPPEFHYAPTHPAIRRRFAQLSRAWADFGADAVLVDVSVEVAMFARLSGYPVLFRRMPGNRTDPGHALAYGSATRLLAYYPAALEDPAHLAAHGAKSAYLGMLAPARSQADAAPAPLPAQPSRARRQVVVQTSLGGGVGLDRIVRAARVAPSWDWQVAGRVDGTTQPLPGNLHVLGVVAEPGPLLAAADVVVTSAGHNAIAASAAARRPAVVIPEERPFGEQAAFAERLRGIPGTSVASSWEAVHDWPALLEALASGPPSGLADALFVGREAFRDGFAALLHDALAGEEPAGDRSARAG
ncbi:hypothetical protein GCM10023081_24290 [Arthrobacter ginkgonis]|uniref:Glycosyl transferase family 28 C-terminal domain-containing protein n=1 Tax=Arthrobacter ginkgonis TaxID=1630594 RepID=A0ABP7CEL2_9MICC